MIDMVKKCICKVIGDAVLPEKKNSVNGVQIAALIFSILAFAVCTAKFVYDIMSRKKCCRIDDDMEDYDYDPSDIYDDDEELSL